MGVVAPGEKKRPKLRHYLRIYSVESDERHAGKFYSGPSLQIRTYNRGVLIGWSRRSVQKVMFTLEQAMERVEV